MQEMQQTEVVCNGHSWGIDISRLTFVLNSALLNFTLNAKSWALGLFLFSIVVSFMSAACTRCKAPLTMVLGLVT
jgi:hypothetical protein